MSTSTPRTPAIEMYSRQSAKEDFDEHEWRNI
jgi:hypothetical protein